MLGEPQETEVSGSSLDLPLKLKSQPLCSSRFKRKNRDTSPGISQLGGLRQAAQEGQGTHAQAARKFASSERADPAAQLPRNGSQAGGGGSRRKPGQMNGEPVRVEAQLGGGGPGTGEAAESGQRTCGELGRARDEQRE